MKILQDAAMMTPDRWRQIEELYHAAQNCHPNERAALLECTDPEIRSRVERMLQVESGSQIIELLAVGTPSDHPGTVVPGAQLGPYKIEAQIGAGGMGTVYRAIDTRLNRVVAIKIAGERYSERFQREAQAISTLNHPNICTLYDVGPNYLVMEFIGGSTLAAEIKKAPLAIESVARYGAQIANALAEAHAAGIVHRDLKPSNIMLTRHGVKVLDFGVAKFLSGSNTDSETGITGTGGIMGTPAYMAPEQVEGLEPSSVTDLFSLGLVLYEMAAGRLPFPGASLGQMLSSGSQPAMPTASRARGGVPASLDRLIAQLLEPDPSKRPQSAAAVAHELSTIADCPAAPTSRIRSLLRPQYTVPAIAVLLILGTAGLWFYRRWEPLTRQAPNATNPASYTQLTSFTDSAVAPTLSPDGRMLAFYRSEKPYLSSDQIWVKLLPNGEPVQVTHDSLQKYNIAFSPDGARIAYTVFRNEISRPFQTYSVSSLAGDSQLMLPNSAGLSWLDDQHLLFSQIKSGVHMGIVTARADGSEPREIYFPVQDRGMAHYSYLSPDRKWVLLVEMDPQWGPCRVVPFTGGSEGRQVGPPGAPCTSAAWSPDGKWMYLVAQIAGQFHLWRQRFPDGQPEQITFGSTEEAGVAVAPDGRSLITSIITRQSSVWIHDSRGERALSSEGYAVARSSVFARDGKHLYYLLRHDSPESPAELWRADLDAGQTEVVLPGVSIREYDISSDEKEVVFSIQPEGQPSQIWIAALDRSSPPRRIGTGGEANPYFGPNNEILFRLTDGKAYYLAAMAQDGSGVRKVLPNRILNIFTISRDRHFIIVGAVQPTTSKSNAPPTLAIPLDGKPPQRICDGICLVAWSPDGRYFYVVSTRPTRENPSGQTVAIRLRPGAALPPLPAGELRRPENWAKIPGAKTVEQAFIAPGLDPSIYAYVNSSTHANLFRIPLR
jgi:eukaryotic-like serine/threonine-protein kinase